ncbi:MAG: DUF5693 family protein [Synergistetes bacterium]|nr:DUF5693 family protein [Synergistota bacterium]
MSVELQNRVFSVSLDMEEIKLLSSIEGVPLETVLRKLKESGANVVSVHALTLDNLYKEGKVLFFQGYEADRYQWLKGDFKPYFTYVLVKDENLLRSIFLSLGFAIGMDKVEIKDVEGGLIIEVKKSLESTIAIPICFSKDEVDLLKREGFKVYLRIRNFRENNPDYIKHIFDEMDLLDTEKVLVFDGEEAFGYPNLLKEVSSEIKKRNYKVGLIEFAKQIGKEEIALYSFPNVLLVHSIDAKEILIYDKERALLRYLRAVKERNMRVLYVRFFFNLRGDLVAENAKYISNLISSIKEAGFVLGSPNPLPNFSKSSFIAFVISFGALAGVTLFLKYLSIFREKYILLFLPLAILSYVFLYFFKGSYFSFTLLALLVSIIFPVWGMLVLIDKKETISLMHNSYSAYLRSFLFLSLYPILISLSAGVYISSILGEPLFMSKLFQFKGVKIAYLFPLVSAGLIALHKEGRNLRSLIKEPFMKEEFLVFLALSGIVGIYLIRSGNIPVVKPISIEREARDVLDILLYARPRFKEFLIGYPSIALFLYLSSKKLLSNYRPLVIMVGTIAPVSVINSFCHIHTPFLLSLLRTINGVIFGWVMGALLLLVLHLFYKK